MTFTSEITQAWSESCISQIKDLQDKVALSEAVESAIQDLDQLFEIGLIDYDEYEYSYNGLHKAASIKHNELSQVA